jgi:chromosome segregation ATPase
MLNTQDLTQIRNYVLQMLPQLLRQEPELGTTIESIMATHFPRRDEFTRLLVELKLHREQVDLQLALQRQEIREETQAIREETQAMREEFRLHREQVDQQMALQRAEILEIRAETQAIREEFRVHREQVDQQMALQRAEIQEIRAETQAIREEFRVHREQVDQQMALQRAEIQEIRAEILEIRAETQAMREEFRVHREQAAQQFLEVRQDIVKLKRGQLKLQASQDRLSHDMKGLEAWLRFVLGELRNEKGKSFEELVAVALRYGLKNPHIKADTIRLRQPLEDTQGIFKTGFATEVDLIAEDGKLTVFEVKASAKVGDVDVFAVKVELVKSQHPTKPVHGILVCLSAAAEIQQRCVELGVELLS